MIDKSDLASASTGTRGSGSLQIAAPGAFTAIGFSGLWKKPGASAAERGRLSLFKRIDEDRREEHDHINRSGRSTYLEEKSVQTSGATPLLRARAGCRGLASATYVSMLVRTHLRKAPPLPDRELTELRSAVGALGAVGRNLNQIARVAHQTGRVEGLTTADLRALLAAYERLRSHFKGLIEANIASWETDHAKASC